MVEALQLSLRAAVAAGLSLAIAQAIGLPSPLYALIAAVIVTDLAPAKTRKLALPRLAGTVLGASVGALACSWLPPSPVSIAAGVGVAMLACQLGRMKDAAKLAGYVSGIVLLQHTHAPWLYAFDRLIETALGIAVAVLVSLVPKLLRARAAPPSPAP